MGRPTSGKWLPRAAALLGELLITAGVVVGLFAVYTLFWTGVETGRAQQDLEAEFEAVRSPAGTTAKSPTRSLPRGPRDEGVVGDVYARLAIPRFGEHWVWYVVEGVDEDDLARGPGHYPGSAEPGEIGNFAVAGHRATYGEPFAALDQLREGDAVLVERGGQTFRYRVTESFLTHPEDAGVLLPVPGDAGAVPGRAIITLTTCHPRWGSAHRLIVHGELVATENDAGGV